MSTDEDQIIEVEQEIIENTEVPEEEETTEPAITQEAEEEEEEDRVVTIGDSETSEEEEEEKPETPKWVKTVRKSNRRLESENKRLKRQIEENEAASTPAIKLGEKPTLSSCDYDDERYEKELVGFYERKRKVDEQAAETEKAIKKQNEAWRDRQTRYVDLKKEHNFKDYEESEELVTNTFSQTQQGIIVQGAEDSALLVYALGKNPKKLEELSKITDPVEFAFKVAKLESQLKVTNKKAPAPEKRVSSGKSGGISGSSDNTLDRLRDEALKTGDYTKVTAYKKKLRG